MESYEYIVRYYTIDDEGIYRRGTSVTKNPSAYIQKHERDKKFVLTSITPIDPTYRIAICVKSKDWSAADA
jgi:hypothetical protein